MAEADLRAALPFPKNEHGHYYINIIGLALRGLTEIHNLENQGHAVDPSARALMEVGGGSPFNHRHMLEEEKIYQVALVPNTELKEPRFSQRTNQRFLKYFRDEFGYSRPPAGVHFRLHELMTSGRMTALGGHYVATLHKPIIGADGHPWILYSRLFRPDDAFPTLTVESGSDQHEWHDNGVFALLTRS